MFQRATLEAFQRWLHNSSQQPQRALNLPSRGWQQSCAPSSCRGAQPQPPPTGGTPRCHPQPAPTQPQPLPTRGMLPTSSCQVSAPARADSGTGRPPQGSCMGGGHALCPSSAPALPSALAAGPRCFAIPSHPLPTPSQQLCKLPAVGRALQGRQSRVTVWEMSQLPAAPAATPYQCSQPHRHLGVGQHRWTSVGLAQESFSEKTWLAGRLLKSCQNSTGESLHL